MLDDDLKKIIEQRIKKTGSKVFVMSSGLTSSHLGDERNLREFLVADEIAKYLRKQGQNSIFYLFDDSSDALTFPKLKVAVNKDPEMIKKGEKYYGMPIKLIPDPFGCHLNHSEHFQEQIIERFHALNLNPALIDVWSLYDQGIYDEAKKIVFTKYKKIQKFLKEKFPNYTMKQIFYPLCPKCLNLEKTEVVKIEGKKIKFFCKNCGKRTTKEWMKTKGKFSWKIDEAIKWNIFKVDFEPFTQSYMDPNYGSFYIAKALSEEFFGGHVPTPIDIGQILIPREISYNLLPSMPREILNTLFLENRKQDLVISEKKVINITKAHLLEGDLSFYDYVRMKLPYDLLHYSNTEIPNRKVRDLLSFGQEFARRFLGKTMQLQLPTKDKLKLHKASMKKKISDLTRWVIEYKIEHPEANHDEFLKNLNEYLDKKKIDKKEFYPIIRQIISLEESIPLSKLFFFVPNSYFYELLAILKRKKRF